MSALQPVADRLRPAGKRLLRRAGIRVQLATTVPHEFDDQPTMQVLVEYARSIRCEGDVAEAGVYQGRSAEKLRAIFPDRELFLLDTFAGMPPVIAPDDDHRTGDFSDTSLELVKQRVGTDRVHYLVGTFAERLGDLSDRRFAFVHLDGDLYQSVRECLEFFGSRVNPGGVILLDDYGFKSCRGAMRATDEWAASAGRHPIWLPSGQAILQF